MVQIKRVYDGYDKKDGYRILVDRLWPRGVSKEKAKIDEWMKDIAPSTELREWFGHDPAKWTEFQKRFKEELQDKKDLLAHIKDIEKKEKTVTLVFAAKDETHNNAVVLLKMLTS
jgi:uncharacterized protein YeaO (DUF488 family)